jgi:hypothetical protein
VMTSLRESVRISRSMSEADACRLRRRTSEDLMEEFSGLGGEVDDFQFTEDAYCSLYADAHATSVRSKTAPGNCWLEELDTDSIGCVQLDSPDCLSKFHRPASNPGPNDPKFLPRIDSEYSQERIFNAASRSKSIDSPSSHLPVNLTSLRPVMTPSNRTPSSSPKGVAESVYSNKENIRQMQSPNSLDKRMAFASTFPPSNSKTLSNVSSLPPLNDRANSKGLSVLQKKNSNRLSQAVNSKDKITNIGLSDLAKASVIAQQATENISSLTIEIPCYESSDEENEILSPKNIVSSTLDTDRSEEGRKPTSAGSVGRAFIPTLASIFEYSIGTIDTETLDIIESRDVAKLTRLFNSNSSHDLLCKIDNQGNSPLHLAAKYGWKKGVSIMLASGADVAAKNHDGKTFMDMITFSLSVKDLRAISAAAV